MVKDEKAKIFSEQYELYVKTAEENSDRRGKAIENLLKLNSLYITADGLFFKFLENDKWLLMTLLSVIGIISSLAFFFLIRSYSQLNGAKFDVIQDMEKHLPAQPFTREWGKLGEGKDRKKYLPFSQIEKVLPIVFVALHFGVLFMMAMQHIRFSIVII